MIVRGESIEAYHANKSVSHTWLKDFAALGPKGFFHRHVQPQPDAQRPITAALTNGQRFESYLDGEYTPVLPPEMIADPPAEPKPWSARRAACKRWAAAHYSATGHTTPISPPDELADDWDSPPEPTAWSSNRKVCQQWLADHPEASTRAQADMYERMRSSVFDNATAYSLLDIAERQVTFRADYPGLPEGYQSRPDYVIQGHPLLGNVIVDLKTCDSLDVFRRNVHRYGYNTQAGLAVHHAELAGIADPSFYLLAVEKQYPTRCVLYRLSQASVATGWEWCRRQLDAIADHWEADHWPQSLSDVEELDAPVWGIEMEAEAAE